MSATVRIGDLAVARLGFGAMRLTGRLPFGEGPDRDTAIAVVRRAVEAGCQLLDTADAYSLGLNEELLAEALHPFPDGVVVATKVGHCRPGDGAWVPLGRPEYLKQQAHLCLMRLRLDSLPLLQLHRIDPRVPLADQAGALRELVEQGLVERVGLSQVTVEQLEEFRQVVPVVSVQNRYNLSDRDDEELVDHCEQEGIAFLPWRPLWLSEDDEPRLRAVATRLGVTAAQVSLAWLLQRSPVMLPIPGTASPEHLEENLAARDLVLDEEALAQLRPDSV
ncbi:oxidoreductase [Nocardioides gansuensis]|uniref:Oxidoreductase n=1 Tax=Nocardioides gansuensis TaxID=2138300 RepID=A0A2T8FCD7_9ACTN|nr:aldo/keto reductase [Nocardioides gansuensis]PVG83378.1 oxidoreductase [Nocardioides gansuensis]